LTQYHCLCTIAKVVAQVKDSGIQFHPRKGEVLICDFTGNIVPEIVKRRPVLVITPRLPNRYGLVTVVPLSSSPPIEEVPYVVRLSKNYVSRDDCPLYAKCDLVCSVALKRLDRLKSGYRKFASPKVDDTDLEAVLKGVKCALGFMS